MSIVDFLSSFFNITHSFLHSFCAAVCPAFSCPSVSCRLFSSVLISSFPLYASCFDFQLLSVFRVFCLGCSVYILCELLATFSKSSVIGTLFTPPHSSTAVLIAVSPIMVSSLKHIFHFVSILLFALYDLSTCTFEGKSA